MKRLLPLIAISGLLFISAAYANTATQPVAGAPPDTAAGVHVARFKDDREAAISFTIDDGREDAATVGAPLFDRYGIHVSFFLIVGGIPDVAGKSKVFINYLPPFP